MTDASRPQHVVASIAFIIIGLLSGCNAKPVPPLVEGLSFTGNGDQPEFTQRLQDRFPLGSPEVEMVHELRLEGFQRGTALRAPKRVATFTLIGSFSNISRRDWAVVWSANDAGRLTSISGSYAVSCP